jgi:hypothetical protein
MDQVRNHSSARQSALTQTDATGNDPPRRRHCDFCRVAEDGTPPRRIFTADASRLRLCRTCISADLDIVEEFLQTAVDTPDDDRLPS